MQADFGGRINANNTTINSTGFGAFAQGAGTALDTIIRLNNVDIISSFTGIGSYNLGGTVLVEQSTINASSGVQAAGGGFVTVNNSTINTSGIQGIGLHASQVWPSAPPVASIINGTNVNINTIGASAHGAYAYNGAFINLIRPILKLLGKALMVYMQKAWH